MKLLTTLVFSLLAITISAQDSSTKVIDKTPRFPSSCEGNMALSDDEKQLCSTKEMLAFITESLIYPPVAKAQGLKGIVEVKIRIDEGGFVWDPTVIKSVHPLLDDEALAVVEKMQDELIWIPAEAKGNPIESFTVIEVQFGPTKKRSFKVVEVMPRFPSECEEDSSLSEQRKKQCADKAMLEYVYGNLVYPVEARREGVSGTVVISFVIDESGNMLDLKVSRSLHPLLDAAAMALMREMQEQVTWIPGQQRGNPIDVQFNLPIRFVDR